MERIIEYMPQLIATGVVLLLTPISRYVFRKLITKFGTLTSKNELRIAHIVRVVNITITFACVVLLTVIWGVQPKNMLVALSSIFAIIGVAMFAQWSILSNVTAGIILFFTAPFKVGDEIEILDKDMPIVATIEDIMSFHTHLRTKEGQVIVIPNSLFMQKVVLLKETPSNTL